MMSEPANDPNRVFLDKRELIQDAIIQGIREALARHRERGLPVVLEQNGEVVWVAADELAA